MILLVLESIRNDQWPCISQKTYKKTLAWLVPKNTTNFNHPLVPRPQGQFHLSPELPSSSTATWTIPFLTRTPHHFQQTHTRKQQHINTRGHLKYKPNNPNKACLLQTIPQTPTSLENPNCFTTKAEPPNILTLILKNRKLAQLVLNIYV
jgi:hypothetical protein